MAHSIAMARALCATLAFLLIPSAASAHTTLRRSAPAKDSSVAVAPTRLSLWFSGTVALPFSSVTLTGPSGAVALGALRADSGNALVADITQPLRAGTYMVHWQTAGADGHPIRGEYSFTVLRDDDRLAQAPPASPLATVEQPPDERAPSPPNPAARWIEFSALLTILGALGFRGIVAPALASRGVSVADARDRARRLGQSAVGLYALAAIIRLYVQSHALTGPSNALSPTSLRVLITGTSWGIGWLTGAIGALLVFAGWKMVKRYTAGAVLVVVGGLGLVTAPAMTGHAMSTQPVALSVAMDALHVAASGFWIGGLLIILFAGIPALKRVEDPDRAIASMVNSFHPLALFCAPIVVITGLVAGWLRLGGVGPLLTTEYGLALLWKVALFTGVLVVGAWNAARVRRQLGTADATRRFRMTGTIELLLAALVVAATSVLVAHPLPELPL